MTVYITRSKREVDNLWHEQRRDRVHTANMVAMVRLNNGARASPCPPARAGPLPRPRSAPTPLALPASSRQTSGAER